MSAGSINDARNNLTLNYVPGFIKNLLVNPVPGLLEKLKRIDFFTAAENREAAQSLRLYFDRSKEYEIDPDFYHIFGVAISSQDYRACQKAQILSINGRYGKESLSYLGELNISIDMPALRERRPNLTLLRSIRWYLTTSFYLLEWHTPEEYKHLRDIEGIGHECIHLACVDGGHWEAIQFYLAVMPFSNDTQLRDKIVRLIPFLERTAREIVQEQLVGLDAVIMVDDDSYDHVETRQQFYEEKITRLLTVLEKIKDHDFSCQLLKEDLKLKVRTTALYIYCHAQILGLAKELKIEAYASDLLKECNFSTNPNGIHIQAVKTVMRAFTILAQFEKLNEAKTSMTSLINRIKR